MDGIPPLSGPVGRNRRGRAKTRMGFLCPPAPSGGTGAGAQQQYKFHLRSAPSAGTGAGAKQQHTDALLPCPDTGINNVSLHARSLLTDRFRISRRATAWWGWRLPSTPTPAAIPQEEWGWSLPRTGGRVGWSLRSMLVVRKSSNPGPGAASGRCGGIRAGAIGRITSEDGNPLLATAAREDGNPPLATAARRGKAK